MPSEMELYRALGLLIEAPTPQHHAVAQALGLPPVPDASTYATEVTFQRYPFASVYLGPQGMMGGEARSRITGFWIALGMEPPGEPDHLSALLSLLASIEEQRAAEPDEAQRALLGEARKVLVGEHLLPWLVPYLVSFQGSADEHFRAWAELLVGALRTLAAEQASTPTVAGVLEELDPLDDPRDEGVGSEFLRGLLAPGRSGVVILRSDLAGAAQDLGLALRAGERSYVLSALFAQDPRGTLAWLGDFAGAWRGRVLGTWGDNDPVAGWWSHRAARSARLLEALSRDPSMDDLVAAP